jgi:hypothetical protein
MSEVIYISNVRLSFPNLVEPQVKINEQTGERRVSYNCELLLPPDHPGLAAFMQRFAALAAEKGKEHANALMQMIQSDRKSRCFGAGEEKVNKRTFQPYDGYAGHWFITAGANEKRQPQMIGPDGNPAVPGDTMAYQMLARKLYGGCRVNAAIKPWWQNPNPQKQVGHGIRCDLIAIQFAGDDKPFGEGMVDTTGMFGAVAGAAPTPPAFAPQMPAAPFQPQMPTAPFAQQPVPVSLPPFMVGR